MRIKNILGGVASSAVIVAMAVVYSSAPREAHARVDPTEKAQPFSAAVGTVPQKTAPRLPKSVNNTDQQKCLAQNIYFESRGESKLGQEAVAWVTLNRVMSQDHPNTICKVVWQSGQFSWTDDGYGNKPSAGAAWAQAKAVAADITARWSPDIDPTQGSVMFHSSAVKPDWHDDFNRVVRIDSHIFYNNQG